MSQPHPEQGGHRSHMGRLGLIIGVVASFVLLVQNAGAATAAGWAFIHGAGPMAVVAFLPLGVALGLLWGGFLYLKRKPDRPALLLFAGHALVVLLLTEVLVPTTPLRRWLAQRAVMSAQVLSIRDEVATTSAGDPIGLRVIYEVRFARRFVGTIYTAQMTSAEGAAPAFPLAFHRAEEKIEPPPAASDIHHVFEPGVIYRVSVTALPSFRFLRYGTGQTCRDTPPGMSDDAMLAALEQIGKRRDRIVVWVSGDDEYSPRPTVADYLTAPYDLVPMYRSVIREGLSPCGR